MNLISLDPIPWQTQFIGLFWAGIFFLVPRDPKRRYRACSNTNCLTNVFLCQANGLEVNGEHVERPLSLVSQLNESIYRSVEMQRGYVKICNIKNVPKPKTKIKKQEGCIHFLGIFSTIYLTM